MARLDWPGQIFLSPLRPRLDQYRGHAHYRRELSVAKAIAEIQRPVGGLDSPTSRARFQVVNLSLVPKASTVT